MQVQKESMAAIDAPTATSYRPPAKILTTSGSVPVITPLKKKSVPLVLLMPTMALPCAMYISSSPVPAGDFGKN